MQEELKAVAFDVDAASLITLRQTFPEWEIEEVTGATAELLDKEWNPHAADLLLVGTREGVAETLGLCRSLRGQAGRAQTPLLVLIAPGQEVLASGALRAGAHGCLILPVHVTTLLGTLARALAGVRREVSYQDEGGEA
jgi:DNA-binding response OmpR family regulator